VLGLGCTHFSASLNTLVVFFPGKYASVAIFGDPAPAGLLVKEIELQNADMYGPPFSILQGPDEISATHPALPVNECAAVDRSLLLRPQMSGREMNLRPA
jgi:hypothetical protein